jgi:hypothetical protein
VTDLSADIHAEPLANRLIDAEIRQWLDRYLGVAEAAAGSDAARRVIEQVRHLHLANYFYTLTPAILDALRRAGVIPAAGSENDNG